LVPLLNPAQWTKSMNIVMLRRGMVFKVRLLFCLTAHIAHANYVAKCTAASCLSPFIVQNRILLYGAHPVFYAKFKEKVPVYLDKCGGLVQTVRQSVVKTVSCTVGIVVPLGGSF
jgi:hypothetical protein